MAGKDGRLCAACVYCDSEHMPGHYDFDWNRQELVAYAGTYEASRSEQNRFRGLICRRHAPHARGDRDSSLSFPTIRANDWCGEFEKAEA